MSLFKSFSRFLRFFVLYRSQKLLKVQNEKSLKFFEILLPNFAPDFAPNFSERDSTMPSWVHYTKEATGEGGH